MLESFAYEKRAYIHEVKTYIHIINRFKTLFLLVAERRFDEVREADGYYGSYD